MENSQTLQDKATAAVKEQEEHWVAVSDLMGGLMMVFLLVSVVYMVMVEIERNKIREIALLYDKLQTQIYQDLYDEFRDDLPRWGAQLNEDLSLSFYRTEILFDKGEREVKDEFRAILADFFPRYVRIITSDTYRQDIAEVRIEGHTSTGWGEYTSEADAYINNMALSQARTRSALGYLLALPEVRHEKDWLKSKLTANGLSSSKPILLKTGEEDPELSRRVEIRLRTDAESRIAAIIDKIR